MLHPPHHSLQTLTEQITAAAKEKWSPTLFNEQGAFLQAYFAGTQAEDLNMYAPIDLFGAAAAHLRLGQHHPTGEPTIHVYNPEYDVDGWQTTHTVIEIVNDDMPFLVDSVKMVLAERRMSLHLLLHPVLAVTRSAEGKLLSATLADNHSPRRESFIHLEIDRQTAPAVLEELKTALSQILADIRVAVADESAMRTQLDAAVVSLAQAPATVLDTAEAAAFLRWASHHHFVLLGHVAYEATGAHSIKLSRISDSALGVLRNPKHPAYGHALAGIPRELTVLNASSEAITLVKSNARSTIHRRGQLDFISVKRYDSKGKVIGELDFVGLYAAAVYHASPADIPVLRQKVQAIREACVYINHSYREKLLRQVLENYPRDELLETPLETLLPIVRGIIGLQERPRARVFLRPDRFGRYYSALVYLPRDNLNAEVRRTINALLLRELGGESSEFNVMSSDDQLARIHYIIRTPAGRAVEENISRLEEEIAHAIRGWRDELHQALLEQQGEERGNALFHRYGPAFPSAYREDFLPRSAAADIEKIDALKAAGNLSMRLYAPLYDDGTHQHFKLFRLNQPISLSIALPMLENLGATVRDEHPYRLEFEDGDAVSISDFGLTVADPNAELAFKSDTNARESFQTLFEKVFYKQCENDGFNRLALLAKLDWRQISLVRAYAKYLRQAGMTFSQTYIEQCLANYPQITGRLVQLFEARLSPELSNETQAKRLKAELRSAMQQVANLDEDRILNGFLSLILATVRTNFWQTDQAGGPKPYISFKLASSAVSFLPAPKPLYEIFVYSPRMEGVHLRGSKVARGGLRWSDRMEDFRTEVLGLLKAQMVKNAVIVPMGSKGGFVCKQLPPLSDREAWLNEGIACYQTLIRGLLDLTDNLVHGVIAHPPQVIRLDEDDPYLVVAADKGTATFSDIANQLALEYGFWLGDAFASGGSAGYDHKKIGITARGAWESVKRHFRHLGIDTQSQPFTVIGIGDMSGDVFGNGMLLSQHIRLICAFDHRHIFLDPSPDAQRTFAERQRLFALPRSSWADFNTALLSPGGGVYARTLKSITLSAEIAAWLETDKEALTPDELLQQCLKARADLLYNGGIGTYIKAKSQSHAEVNDRANDALRVNGCELRVKVVAEGGNLGFTQLGRIEYALTGGRILTDAFDNSAGVDCSDHEVNIKILLDQIVTAADMTLKQRNVLLADMTDEVAQLVLKNNYLQTQVIDVGQRIAPSMLSMHARFIQHLEQTGQMKRALEYLPDEAVFSERRLAKRGLVPSETAVLTAYSKIELYQHLLESDLPDQEDFAELLVEYFPQPLQKRYRSAMPRHYLRREIIANQLANEMANRMGATFVFRLQEERPVAVADIARAWRIASQVMGARLTWQRIEGLDNTLSPDRQAEMMMELRTLLERSTRWLLRNCRPLHEVNRWINEFAPPVAQLVCSIAKLIRNEDNPRVQRREERLREAGFPQELAVYFARIDELVSVFDIIEVATQCQLPLDQVAANYFELGRALQLNWLRQAITHLPRDNRWHSLARTALRDDLYRQQRGLLLRALTEASDSRDESRVKRWLGTHHTAVALCQKMFGELQSYDQLDVGMLSAAMRELHNQLMV